MNQVTTDFIQIKTSKDIESFQADNVTLAEKVNDVENYDEYDTPGRFTGTFVKTTIPEDGLFISDNKFWYSISLAVVKKRLLNSTTFLVER